MRFTRELDDVFRFEGVRVIKARVGAPKARAHAERWVGSVRRECLDRLLVLGRRHLHHVLATYLVHYNGRGPPRALAQRPPLNQPPPKDEQSTADVIALDRVRRCGLLGGLIHEYELDAQQHRRGALPPFSDTRASTRSHRPESDLRRSLAGLDRSLNPGFRHPRAVRRPASAQPGVGS